MAVSLSAMLPSSPFFSVVVSSILGLVVLLALALLCLSVVILRLEYRFKDIPGPKRSSFFWGNMKELQGLRDKPEASIAQICYKLAREYGPIVWLRVLWKPTIFSTSPELVKEMLLSSRHPKSDEFYKVFQGVFGARFLGHGLVSVVDHEKWHSRRTIINPAFKRKYLIGMMEQFNEGAEALCESIVGRADGKTPIAMLDELNNATLDVIAKVAFGMNTDAVGNPTCPFPAAISTALRGLQETFRNPLIAWDFSSKSRKFRKEVKEAINLVRTAGRKCVEERINARQRGDHVPHDILNMILECSNDLKGSSDFQMEDMIDEFATLFIAGQETTSNLLAFTIHQLGRHPDVAKRLQAEVDEVLGEKPFIEYEDLAKLEYMMRVFKETLRLYPPAPGSTRKVAHPIKCNGITIPAGTSVSLMTGAMSRMEEYFEDPLLFNPDRFKTTDEEHMKRHFYAYFPFSLGQRSCIGQQFALIEARVLLGRLLQKFKFRLDQSQRTAVLDELTAKPKDGCKNFVTLRT
ncbi:cholesterol 24-hydroxylase-like [Diadema antillarum]|uniref:cholesterol 24-hydroxylase-like n=1 Tax=Diadema antillarum TaxID=105358 RepID=UPI003A87B673